MNNTIWIAIGALIVGGLGGYIVAGQSGDWSGGDNKYRERADTAPMGMHRMPDGSMMGTSNTQANTGMGMMGGMGMGMGMMMVNTEKEFLTEMIPHHEEAVATAKEVLARGGTTPEIQTLVTGIVTAQEKEIGDMKTWYAAWYGTPYVPSGKYEPMMRDLTKLSGQDLDKAFLEDMIMHHMGAIMMAHSVQGVIEHKEVEDLSKAIISSQSKEIQTMRRLRAGL
ncbi:MAG: DUF305 domain-containing protein [Candidatus Pacebacteria bacterium]|jgi:uncharacterized protein (DUF305 family)|nr:DUF305 domain-containing protein [Candidatus Paceibacterota bacterium]